MSFSGRTALPNVVDRPISDSVYDHMTDETLQVLSCTVQILLNTTILMPFRIVRDGKKKVTERNAFWCEIVVTI